MHLIFLHGVAGVGKRTVATELAKELGFPFLNFYHLATLLGPAFGYTSPTFHELRDVTTQRMVEQALKTQEDGIICSFTYDPTIPLANYRAHILAAKESDGIGLFVGLTCDKDELKQRLKIPARRYDDVVSDLQVLEETMSTGNHELPDLPGPSIVIDTTGESPEQTVQNIIAMLPDSMKQAISF